MRYILFSGASYYADGGALDIAWLSDDLEDCVARGKRRAPEWWHVYDTVSNTVVDYKTGSYCGCPGLKDFNASIRRNIEYERGAA